MAHFRRYLILLLTFALPGVIFAQPEVDTVSFNFTVVGVRAEPRGLFVRAAPGQIVPLTFASVQRSVEYRYRGPRRIAFVRQIASERGPTWAEVSAVEVPTTVSKPLFIFFPRAGGGADQGGEWAVCVFDDAEQKFPRRSLSLINASGKTLTGLAGEQSVTLEPGPGPTFGSGDELKLQLAIEHQGRFYPAFERIFDLEEDERALCILLPPPTPASPAVRSFLLRELLAARAPATR